MPVWNTETDEERDEATRQIATLSSQIDTQEKAVNSGCVESIPRLGETPRTGTSSRMGNEGGSKTGWYHTGKGDTQLQGQIVQTEEDSERTEGWC